MTERELKAYNEWVDRALIAEARLAKVIEIAREMKASDDAGQIGAGIVILAAAQPEDHHYACPRCGLVGALPDHRCAQSEDKK